MPKASAKSGFNAVQNNTSLKPIRPMIHKGQRFNAVQNNTSLKLGDGYKKGMEKF